MSRGVDDIAAEREGTARAHDTPHSTAVDGEEGGMLVGCAS